MMSVINQIDDVIRRLKEIKKQLNNETTKPHASPSPTPTPQKTSRFRIYTVPKGAPIPNRGGKTRKNRKNIK